MADPNLSPLKFLQVPIVAGDNGLWGGYLNNTIGYIDNMIGGAVGLPSSTYGTAATLTTAQLQNFLMYLSGSPGATFTLNMYSSLGGSGLYTIFNNFSDGSAVHVVNSSFGSVTTVPAATTPRLVALQGGNAFFADSQLNFPLQTGIEFGMDGSSLPPPAGRKPGVVLPFSFTAQNWEIICADNGSASISLNFESAYSTISGASSLGFSGSISNSGTTSGWGTTFFSSGTFLSVNVNSASAGTKYTACLLGIRTT